MVLSVYFTDQRQSIAVGRSTEFDTSSILGVDPKYIDARNHYLDRITLGLWSR